MHCKGYIKFIVTILVPEYGARTYMHHVQDGTDIRNKKSIVAITSQDNMCMSRAIVVGTAALRNKQLYEKLRKSTSKLQTVHALNLLKNLCLKSVEKQPMSNINMFEKNLNIQIIVISCELGNKVVYKGPHKVEKVFLYSVGEHFHLIKNISGFFAKKHFCDHCLLPYDNKKKHSCEITCSVCCHSPCFKGTYIKCDKCNIICRSSSCFQRHQKKRPKLPSLCDSYWRCDLCTRIIETKQCTRSQHSCGDILCPNCKEYVGNEHTCYIKYLEPKKSSSKYIFYDFECMVHEATHVPNLCVALKVCERCIGSFGKCSKCGDEKNDYSTYYVFDDGTDTVNTFCSWLFNVQNKGYTVLAHNSKAYDCYFCIEYLLRNSVRPKVIFSGSKIMYLHVQRGLDIKLIDSLNFICMPLKKLPKCFGLNDSKKGEFPHMFNKGENQNYIGAYPEIKYYGVDRLKTADKEEFVRWYERVQHQIFDFKAEIIAYCKNDVWILAKACIEYRKLFLTAAGVDPFQYVTVASACMGSFKAKFCQEKFKIDDAEVTVTGRQFPAGKTKTFVSSFFPYQTPQKDTYSASSIKWLEWLSYKNNIKICHALNSGEYKVPGSQYKLDGYVEASKTALEFHSCMFHGCPSCYPVRSRRIAHLDQTVQELYNVTMAKKKYLVDRGYKYVCFWYHEYVDELKNNKDFKLFTDTVDVAARLDPREALFGGRTNAIQLYYKQKLDEKISYLDFTSLYPYINKTKTYMTCMPEIITRDFSDVHDYFGFIKCVILPPRGLRHPVLPHRIGGKLLFPLCNACAEVGLTRDCMCTDEERSLKGTWATVEVQKALELKYKILKIYEVWNYPNTLAYTSNTSGLFSGYINSFLKYKEEASGWPSTCVTQKDRDRYRKDYFEREGITLENVEKNDGLRSVAKICLNNLWGKFAQRTDLSQTIFCTDPTDFFVNLTDPEKIIKDFKIINEDVVMLVYNVSKEAEIVPIFSNVPIAALTTAYARLHLYSVIEKLDDRVLYFDTDSVIYIERLGQWCPPCGSFLGELKSELNQDDSIIEFASAGPKNYAYKTKKGESVVKVRGITLTHEIESLVNIETIKKIIKDHNFTVSVPEKKFIRNKNNFTISTVESRKKYKFTYSKRMLLADGNNTLPYGY